VGPPDSATALTELPLACTGSPSELTTVQPTGRTTFFRVAPSDPLQTGPLANFAFTTRAYRRIVIVNDASPVGAAEAGAFSARFMADGGTVLRGFSVPPTQSYVSLLTQIAALKPDALVYIGGTDATAGTVFRQQMAQVPGLTQTPFITTALLHSADFLQPTAPGGNPAAFRAAVLAALTHTSFAGADGQISFAPNGDVQQGSVEIDHVGSVLPGGPSAWIPQTVTQVAEPPALAILSPTSADVGPVPIHGGSATTTLTLPSGLRLDRRTGEIVGTPRHAGAVRLRIEVLDDTHPATTATRVLRLTIARRHRRRHQRQATGELEGNQPGELELVEGAALGGEQVADAVAVAGADEAQADARAVRQRVVAGEQRPRIVSG
jgi:Periplasmic binding protein/Putative Ig domain